VTTDLKMRTKRTWDDVGRAMENLVNCEPTTSRGLRALTSFLRQYPPLAEILRSGDASGLKNLFTILDLAAQRLA
jgi:hypothetical protein